MTTRNEVSAVSNDFNQIMNQYKEIINNIPDSGWQGDSKNSIISSANDFVSEYESPINSQLDILKEALTLLEEYMATKEEIGEYEGKIQSVTDTDNNQDLLNVCAKRIESLTLKNESLSKSIRTLIEEICSNIIQRSSYSLDNFDIASLLNNKDLRKLGENENLTDLYEEGYIESTLDDIKNDETLSGREKTVISALTLIKLAADKGVKLDYDYGGAHVSNVDTEDILEGADCSSFATYLLNQGSNEQIGMMTTATIKNKYSKYEVNYENAKPGDLLNCNNSKIKHVEVIMENHPEEGYFITAEAKGSKYGIVLTKTYYKDCKKQGQSTYNMDSIYEE